MTDVRSALHRPARSRHRFTRTALIVAVTLAALIAGVGPASTALAEDGVGTVPKPVATGLGESPQTVQGAPPADAVDPAPSATASEWIVLCQSFSPCKSAGYGNAGYDAVYTQSFWSQYSGHNCTNYVAYRLIGNGMSSTRPTNVHGYARDWGVNLASQTNDTPAVGSVAWWDSSFSSSGHVAYVERVISNDEIVISEDNWGGDFRWRKVTRTGGRWPQGFIHLKDVSTTTSYQPITPARLVDTRWGLGAAAGQVAPGGELSVQVAGRSGIPAGVSSVVLNVTAVTARSPGVLLAYPSGTTRPNASNVNYRAGDTVANQVVAKVGADGRVRVWSSGQTHVIVDIAGYYRPTPGLMAITPKRVLDTRASTGEHLGSADAGEYVSVPLAASGVPAGTGAVVLNVTAVNPREAGWLTLWQSGATIPRTSNVNFAKGNTTAGLVVARVGADGRVTVRSSQETDLVVDVLGYAAAGSDVVALTPARLLDTRATRTPMAAWVSGTLGVAGRGGVPTGVTAVLLNVTVTGPTSASSVLVYTSGLARPATSTLNFAAGQTVANSVVVKVGTDGNVRLVSGANTHLIVDVQGYIR